MDEEVEELMRRLSVVYTSISSLGSQDHVPSNLLKLDSSAILSAAVNLYNQMRQEKIANNKISEIMDKISAVQ